MPAALELTDVSKSVSAVSLGDLDLDANYVGGDMSWTPPVTRRASPQMPQARLELWLAVWPPA